MRSHLLRRCVGSGRQEPVKDDWLFQQEAAKDGDAPLVVGSALSGLTISLLEKAMKSSSSVTPTAIMAGTMFLDGDRQRWCIGFWSDGSNRVRIFVEFLGGSLASR
nr:hypothetical protein Itr_chr01CG06510 [Ipomoea trifida]